MDITRKPNFSRRDVLRTSLMVGAGSALGAVLPGSARAQEKTLDMWWWGEQELPGLQKFVDSSIAGFKDATVKGMLQDTAVVISQFQTAAAAGNAPLLPRHVREVGGERGLKLGDWHDWSRCAGRGAAHGNH